MIDGVVPPDLPPQCEWDPRVEKFRAPAVLRRAIVQYFEKREIGIEDASSSAQSAHGAQIALPR